MAKIESLPNIDWSPAACLANLLENADDIEEMIIIYRSKEDGIQYSAGGNICRRDALWMIELEKKIILGSD